MSGISTRMDHHFVLLNQRKQFAFISFGSGHINCLFVRCCLFFFAVPSLITWLNVLLVHVENSAVLVTELNLERRFFPRRFVVIGGGDGKSWVEGRAPFT